MPSSNGMSQKINAKQPNDITSRYLFLMNLGQPKIVFTYIIKINVNYKLSL